MDTPLSFLLPPTRSHTFSFVTLAPGRWKPPKKNQRTACCLLIVSPGARMTQSLLPASQQQVLGTGR